MASRACHTAACHPWKACHPVAPPSTAIWAGPGHSAALEKMSVGDVDHYMPDMVCSPEVSKFKFGVVKYDGSPSPWLGNPGQSMFKSVGADMLSCCCIVVVASVAFSDIWGLLCPMWSNGVLTCRAAMDDLIARAFSVVCSSICCCNSAAVNLGSNLPLGFWGFSDTISRLWCKTD